MRYQEDEAQDILTWLREVTRARGAAAAACWSATVVDSLARVTDVSERLAGAIAAVQRRTQACALDN